MDFQNYGVPMRWLYKCLKCPLSAEPLTGNMVNGPKECLNINGSTFIIFIDHCEGN